MATSGPEAKPTTTMFRLPEDALVAVEAALDRAFDVLRAAGRHRHIAALRGPIGTAVAAIVVARVALTEAIDGDPATATKATAPQEPAQDHVWFSQASRDVLAERRRQVEVEGWTPEHDDQHSKGEMVDAAACYALMNPQIEGGYWTYGGRDPDSRWVPPKPRAWPFHADWWKPAGRRRSLVKAASLLIAEIERLDRTSEPAPAETPPGPADIDTLIRDSVAAYARMSPEERAAMHRAQRRSWAIGEAMLADLSLSREEAARCVDAALRRVGDLADQEA